MSRSSTSSSEPGERKRPRRLPMGAIGAVALLVLFDVGVVRRDWFWAWVTYSQGGVIDALEQQVLADAHPKILLLGSSRVRDALAPRVIEQQLGLGQGDVLNLGITFGTAWDAKILYERNRANLSSARVAFFAVEPYQFNHYDDDSERVSRFGSFRDRLGYFHGSKQLRKGIGYFWRAVDAGPPMRRFIKSLWKGRPAPPIGDDGRIEWRTEEDNARAVHRDSGLDAQRYFRAWRPNKWRRDQLRDLIGMLQADGIEVVLFQIPTRDDFWDHVQRDYIVHLDEYIRSVEDSAAGHAIWWSWRGTPERLGGHAFYDYGHMRDFGSIRYSRAFAKKIRRSFGRFLELPPPEPTKPKLLPMPKPPSVAGQPGRTKKVKGKRTRTPRLRTPVASPQKPTDRPNAPAPRAKPNAPTG